MSPLITDNSTLNSYLKLELYGDDLSIDASTEVFEDLSKGESDKYEYVFPNFGISKINLNNFGGELYFRASGNQRLYNTNVKESLLINIFI